MAAALAPPGVLAREVPAGTDAAGGAGTEISALRRPPRDPAIEARVEQLLDRMTLDEKIGQLNLISNEASYKPQEVATGRVGAVINFNHPPDILKVQGEARSSRLGIPLLVGLDVLHGFRTMFPVPLGQAASFDPALVQATAAAAGREAAAMGLTWTYAPMADVARDPRWGRIVEGSGEDPTLSRLMTAARVRGFRSAGVAVAVKHFAGYGAPEGGRDYDTTLVPTPILRDQYLPPFRDAVEAGAETFMSAFNALNGVPSTANHWLLTEVLRGEWGFDGFVTSDWGAIHELIAHGVARDGAEAARKAILAGVDMDMMSGLYAAHLADEVRAGRVPMAVLDQAVRRVLRVKLRMGLFDRPPVDAATAERALLTPEARGLARKAARESFVLLQNRDEVLPVGAKVRKIAVVGSLAASQQDPIGPHGARAHAPDTISILQGIQSRAAAAGVGVTFAEGCNKVCDDTTGFEAAVATARDADLVVAVVGEPETMSGEAASRVRLTLPGEQERLVEELAATGKPVVLAIMGGRPLEIGGLLDKIAGAMMVWYPGTEGGAAFAEVLFGDHSPGGKLPVTWVRTASQAPLTYNRLPTGRPTDPTNRFTLGYLDEAVTPQFPFGWGLSYGRFAYDPVEVVSPELAADGTLEVRVRVTNTGAHAGPEVAQLYVRQPVASRSRPLRELKAFEKFTLGPGESRLVTFRVPARDLGFHTEDGTYEVEPGLYEVGVGGHALVELAGRFEITTGLRVPPRREEGANKPASIRG